MESKTEKNVRAIAAVARLKKVMVRRGLLQEPTAAELRVTLVTLNRWLNHRGTPKSILTIESIESFNQKHK